MRSLQVNLWPWRKCALTMRRRVSQSLLSGKSKFCASCPIATLSTWRKSSLINQMPKTSARIKVGPQTWYCTVLQAYFILHNETFCRNTCTCCNRSDDVSRSYPWFQTLEFTVGWQNIQKCCFSQYGSYKCVLSCTKFSWKRGHYSELWFSDTLAQCIEYN